MRAKQQAFNIERVKEFCKRINNGETPTEALTNMKASRAYGTPLRRAGFFWTEKDGTYKAVERVYTERYELFSSERKKFNNINFNRQMEKTRQATLFNQPKPKTGKISSSKNIMFTGQTMTLSPAPAPTMKAKKKQLNFIQRVVKSLFKL